jgi:hypothetical protein
VQAAPVHPPPQWAVITSVCLATKNFVRSGFKSASIAFYNEGNYIMNKLVTLAMMLVSVVGSVAAQKKVIAKCGLASDAEICKLPQMFADPSSPGYVDVVGKWSPTLSEGMEENLQCVRSAIPQFSDSKVGVCLLAEGGLSMGLPTVRVEAYDVISWGETQIVAQSSQISAQQECERLTFVIDLRSNTVTLTDTLDRTTTGCAKRWQALESLGTPTPPTASVFQLVHAYATVYADAGMNKYLLRNKL